jgi:hypothetical protein
MATGPPPFFLLTMKHLFLLAFLAIAGSAFGQLRTIVLPSEVDASGVSAPVNVADLKGQARVILTAKSFQGTNPTLASKLQVSSGVERFSSVASAGENGTAMLTNNSTNVRLAAKHVATSNSTITEVLLPLKKNGALSGNVTVSLQADNAGAPSGTPLASAVVLSSALPTSFESVTFAFSPGVNVTTNSTYWIVATPNYTANATVNAAWRDATVASDGNSSTFNGSAWTAGATKNFGVVIRGHTFVDLATFTTVNATGSVQSTEFPLGNAGALRINNTLGGTSTPKFIQSAVLVQ